MLQILARTVTGRVSAEALFCYSLLADWSFMKKRFLTYEEQLDYLEVQKGLQIPNRKAALKTLERTSYFFVFGGYKHPFRNPSTGRYRDGVTFDEVMNLYEFDASLRLLVLKYILHIERHIKALYSYCFSEKFGNEQEAYLQTSHYNYCEKYEKLINNLIRSFRSDVEKPSDYAYIRHFQEKHKNVPLWVLIHSMSIGTIAKLYQVSHFAIQSRVSRKFQGVNERQLAQFLNVLNKFRNVCAHNEQLFAHQCEIDIPDMPIHMQLKLPKKGNQYKQGKHDLFAIVIAFYYLLPWKEFSEFVKELEQLIQESLPEFPHLSHEALLQEMGFPNGWYDFFIEQ